MSGIVIILPGLRWMPLLIIPAVIFMLSRMMMMRPIVIDDWMRTPLNQRFFCIIPMLDERR
jgi:hypothetical protein